MRRKQDKAIIYNIGQLPMNRNIYEGAVLVSPMFLHVAGSQPPSLPNALVTTPFFLTKPKNTKRLYQHQNGDVKVSIKEATWKILWVHSV